MQSVSSKSADEDRGYLAGRLEEVLFMRMDKDRFFRLAEARRPQITAIETSRAEGFENLSNRVGNRFNPKRCGSVPEASSPSSGISLGMKVADEQVSARFQGHG
jgi:hypothetical protein